MSKSEQLKVLMLDRFYKNFVEHAASKVIELDAMEEIYTFATDNSIMLPRTDKQALIFRSAYTLEYLYFKHHSLFVPFTERFINDYSLCENTSAKRHFTKMMNDILQHNTLTDEQLTTIAETTANWLIEPKVKVAVKIGAISILAKLRGQVGWINEIWNDIEAVMLNEVTPAIEVRFKRGWK